MEVDSGNHRWVASRVGGQVLSLPLAGNQGLDSLWCFCMRCFTITSLSLHAGFITLFSSRGQVLSLTLAGHQGLDSLWCFGMSCSTIHFSLSLFHLPLASALSLTLSLSHTHTGLTGSIPDPRGAPRPRFALVLRASPHRPRGNGLFGSAILPPLGAFPCQIWHIFTGHP